MTDKMNINQWLPCTTCPDILRHVYPKPDSLVLYSAGMNHDIPHCGFFCGKKGLPFAEFKFYRLQGYCVSRLTPMDLLAEKYYHISPYAYCGNNPVNCVDLHGDSITIAYNTGFRVGW